MLEILKSEERVVFSLRKLYTQYGYRPYKMSRFEEYDLYVRNKDFLLSDQIITFSDKSGRLLALKPDVTLSIIKNTQDNLKTIQKLYYNENVYRIDKGSQTYKEIMQAGLECVGNLGPFETAEVVLLAAKSLALVQERFVLDLSHMGLLSAIMEDSGLDKENRKKAMTFLHQKNAHEMRALCLKGRCSERAETLLTALTTLSGAPGAVISQLIPLLFTQEQLKLLQELKQVCDVLSDQGFGENINIDFSAGSHMKYYSGVVFCGYVQGIPNVILSGGQYDALLRKMGKNCKAIGFAIYLDLLQRIQKKENRYDLDTVLLYDADSDCAEVMEIAQGLRALTTVLVTQTVPSEISYRRLMKVKNGEAVLLEEYG